MIQQVKTGSRKSKTVLDKLITGRNQNRVQTYGSQAELAEQLKALQDQKGITVVLLLSGDFDGHLPSIIRRRVPGEQLIVTSNRGFLPGLVGGRDIAFRAGMLGWNRLSFVHDLNDVLNGPAASEIETGSAVILVPEEIALAR